MGLPGPPAILGKEDLAIGGSGKNPGRITRMNNYRGNTFGTSVQAGPMRPLVAGQKQPVGHGNIDGFGILWIVGQRIGRFLSGQTAHLSPSSETVGAAEEAGSCAGVEKDTAHPSRNGHRS